MTRRQAAKPSHWHMCEGEHQHAGAQTENKPDVFLTCSWQLLGMPKRSTPLETVPPAVLAQMRTLGKNLTNARKRRREPLKTWAPWHQRSGRRRQADRTGVSRHLRRYCHERDPGL
jgi:hypothetical protein